MVPPPLRSRIHRSILSSALRQSLHASAQNNASDIATPGQPFERRVEDVKPCKSDINLVVLDYLINEGFPEAAKKFAAEANIHQKPGDSDHIQERVEIRNNILAGKIQSAIEQLNDLAPELLEQNTPLHFSLLRLQLIELIRSCVTSQDADITPALDFAQNQLAPLAPTNPSFLSDLERTMALLIFPADSLTPQLQALLNPELRVKVAERVNEALLGDMGCPGTSRLRHLARLRVWSENKARGQGLEVSASGLDLWGHGFGNNDGSNGSADVTMAA